MKNIVATVSLTLTIMLNMLLDFIRLMRRYRREF